MDQSSHGQLWRGKKEYFVQTFHVWHANDKTIFKEITNNESVKALLLRQTAGSSHVLSNKNIVMDTGNGEPASLLEVLYFPW